MGKPCHLPYKSIVGHVHFREQQSRRTGLATTGFIRRVAAWLGSLNRILNLRWGTRLVDEQRWFEAWSSGSKYGSICMSSSEPAGAEKQR